MASDATLVTTHSAPVAQSGVSWYGCVGELLDTLHQGTLTPASITNVTVSRDGARVAVRDEQLGRVLIADLTGGAVTPVGLDSARVLGFPTWSPDGIEMALSGNTGDGNYLYVQSILSSEMHKRLSPESPAYPNDWSRDGRYLVYHRIDDETRRDLYYLERRPDGSFSEPIALLTTPEDESLGRFSPDGSLLAYVKTEGGVPHIYVQSFPESDFRKKVSTSNGSQPRWSPLGDGLFYVASDTLMSISAKGREFGTPRKLFSNPALVRPDLGTTRYDVSPDGQRFIMLSPAEGSGESAGGFRVWQNWYERFREDQER